MAVTTRNAPPKSRHTPRTRRPARVFETVNASAPVQMPTTASTAGTSYEAVGRGRAIRRDVVIGDGIVGGELHDIEKPQIARTTNIDQCGQFCRKAAQTA